MLSFDHSDKTELEGLEAFHREAPDVARAKPQADDPLDVFPSEASCLTSLISVIGAEDSIRSCNQESFPAPRLNTARRAKYSVAAAAFFALAIFGGAALGRSWIASRPVAVPPTADIVPSSPRDQPQKSDEPEDTAFAPSSSAERAIPIGTSHESKPETSPLPGKTETPASQSSKSTHDTAISEPPLHVVRSELNLLPVPALPKPTAPAIDRVASSLAPSVAAAAPAPPPAAPSRDEDDVRNLLSRFQSAYDRLDASAAKSIWPSVNERALARAFDGLESQDVSFADCRLSVSAMHAQAYCTGTARYVRRVGSKAIQQEARQWSFSLSKDENTWRIETVEMR